MACNGNGSIYDQLNSPEMRNTIRQALVRVFNPRKVAKELGIGPEHVTKVRSQLLRDDPTFADEVRAYQESLKAIAMDAFEEGLAVASEIAKNPRTSAIARVSAAKVLTGALADLERGTGKVELAISGSVKLEAIDELRKRLLGEDDQGTT